jgi:hypothetical protein
MYREALTRKKIIFGDEHPEVATGLNNLASLLEEQVRFGFEHVPENLLCFFVSSIRTPVFLIKGKMDEAELMYRKALAINKKIYGDEHPEVAEDLNNLASVLEEQVSLVPKTIQRIFPARTYPKFSASDSLVMNQG